MNKNIDNQEISSNNMDKLNALAKKMVISLGLMLLFGLALFIYFYSKKEKTKVASHTLPSDVTQPIKALRDSVPDKCTPFEITHKDSYISLFSKNCNKLKIINTQNFKILELDI